MNENDSTSENAAPLDGFDLARIIAERQATMPPYEPPKPLGWTPARKHSQEDFDRALARLRERVHYSDDLPIIGEPQPTIDELRQRQAEGYWKDFIADIGDRYRGCTLETFEITDDARQRPVLDALRAFRDGLAGNVAAGANLLLVGPCGSGKDHLLTALAREACRLRLRVAWTNGPRLFADARDGIGSDERESRLVETLTRPAVLVLSDPLPPNRELTAFQSDLLYRVIDERYRRLRPVWVSLNLGPNEADKTLGAQVADRLRDGALVLECRWASYRKPTPAKLPHQD